MLWLRRIFITGFFVTVPLIISVAALVWVFNVIDGSLVPLYARWLGRRVPGLGVVTTAALVLLVGVFSTNLIGKRLVLRAEALLQRIPVFGAIYGPVKQLLAAFSPDSASGFKKVVLVEDHHGRTVLGFLTKEFRAEGPAGARRLVAVFVPTNHLYLGDVLVFDEDSVTYPDITVEEAVRIFLTAGMALPASVRVARGEAARPRPST